ncbi:transposase [Actinoplanes friuliensis DSM 7358]|uniref:Transposase n=1 Tax=Actinoplanes friuliensis DSM 7358 TaxID=1246995 RepID=U5W4M0_9ACTN|nr:transposase [Actinoplanes friuliensis DSM 7358]
MTTVNRSNGSSAWFPAADGEALGRSRGGPTTKIHLAVDGRGQSWLTPGRSGDNPQPFVLLDAIRVHHGGPGRPRKRPDMLIADKAYAHDPTRCGLRRRGIAHTIPERVRPGRPPSRQRQPRRTTTRVRQTGLPATWWSAASTDSSNGDH